MKKNKIEIIRQASSDLPCYGCDGEGTLEDKSKCPNCKGTGIFVDNHYIMIVNGMAFNMDSIK